MKRGEEDHEMGKIELTMPVIGILRGIDAEFFSRVIVTSFAAGLQALEVTMNTEGALDMVAGNRPLVPDGHYLGMGTVRNLEEARLATQAGAMFLVTPNVDVAVIEHANEQQVPVIVGALTPTEVYAAWSAGAAMVKVFPCRAMGGAAYIADLLGPFDAVPLVAVGGVTRENLAEYLQAGARAVGVSTALFGRQALAEKNLPELAENVARFIGSCREAMAAT